MSKRYRHLNFLQHISELEVRVPRMKLPDGSLRQVEPPWAGKLSRFTLLFEALVVALCRKMSFSGVARLTGLSVYRVMRIYELRRAALSASDWSEVRRLAIDETSRAKRQQSPGQHFKMLLGRLRESLIRAQERLRLPGSLRRIRYLSQLLP